MPEVQFDTPEFLARLRAGDNNAWEELACGMEMRLKAVILQILWGSPNAQEEAEDILQEVFKSAYCSITTFRGDSSIKTWLYRIARNKTLTHIRKKKGGVFISEGDAPEEWGNSLSEGPGPEERCQQRQIEELKKIWKDTLSPANRRLWELHKEGWTEKEIAEMLGVPGKPLLVGTVTSRLSRLRENLWDFLLLEWLGIVVVKLSDQQKLDLSVPEGFDGIIAQEVRPGSAAMKAGLRVEDLILTIGEMAVNTVKLFTKIMNMLQVDTSKYMTLTVARAPEWKKVIVRFMGRNGSSRV